MEITTYKNFLKEKVLIFDGAMGTNLQRFNPTLDDYDGKEGCTEMLLVKHPDWIAGVHESFFKVGCDVVETNSFGANRLVFAEYGIAELAYEFNVRAAKLAKEVAHGFSTKAQPRWVAGSMGPGTKLPSLGHVDFNTLRTNYAEQAEGLLEGGADILLIETCQDLLQVKAAVNGALDAMAKRKVRVPLNVQVTMESTGTMLVGADMAAAITVIESLPVDTIGINCATGPLEMSEHVRTLSQLTNRYISILPNAGLPENVGGNAVYRLTPKELATHLKVFVEEHGVNVVGGCCGTTPEHLAEVVKTIRPIKPPMRSPTRVASVASLYFSTSLRQEPAPLLVGERTNANGSKLFRDVLNANDYEGLVAIAKDQEAEGAHVLDVCTAFVGRDEVADMVETVRRYALQVRVPLMIDSTEAPVIEAALQHLGGKAIVNSINLEDGEARVDRVCEILKTHGAAVVALTIDETGMAKTVERKMAVAKRLHDIWVHKHKRPASDLIFDALTFTLGSGDEEFRKAGIETLEAIRQIKKEWPDVHTILGLSNISFGLKPAARVVVNSVFLHHALEAGLDAAIVNAKKILPLSSIDPQARALAKALIFDERKVGPDGTVTFDPLQELIRHFEAVSGVVKIEQAVSNMSLEEKLKDKIIKGNRQGLEPLLDEALKKYTALEIINTILLEGMRVVGELFGSGQLQLPFVLQSAETMKAAVKQLEPHIPKASVGLSKGKMVLATVKGDVHDIGKNLVDIILSNNGYTVVNLGIKQPLDAILKAADEVKPDAIGLSGLLVKSTAVMKENLEEMNKRGINYDVILGGAALTRKFVEHDLRNIYKGRVFYARDAFDGLRLMDEIKDLIADKKLTGSSPITPKKEGPLPQAVASTIISLTEEDPETPTIPAAPPLAPALRIPTPPFWGTRIVRGIDLKEVFGYINETALLKVRWGFKRVSSESTEAYQKMLSDKVMPLYEKWKKDILRGGCFQPMVAYGYYPCQSDGNDLVVFDEEGKKEVLRFTFPRQKKAPRLCIADYFRPVTSKEKDVLPLSLVTIGKEATPYIKSIYEKNAYTDYLYAHGLSVETAEALAEYWHKRIRQELKIDGGDGPNVRDLFHQGYQGSRYSFGYPACPNLEDQTKLFTLLKPERIGVTLSEEFQLDPEQSTSAIIVHHPAAKYFAID